MKINDKSQYIFQLKYAIIPSLTLNKKRNSAKLFNKGLKCCFVLCNEYAYII